MRSSSALCAGVATRDTPPNADGAELGGPSGARANCECATMRRRYGSVSVRSETESENAAKSAASWNSVRTSCAISVTCLRTWNCCGL